MPGDGDPWQSLWGFWFFHHSLTTTGQVPATTNLLFYPLGTAVGYISFALLTGLISLPLVAVAGIVVAYNVMLVGGLALAGYAAFLLVRRVVGQAGPAFVGGLVFAFSPYHMAHSLEHVFLLTSAVWVPLYVLFAVRTLDEGRALDVVLAALCLAFTAISNPYYTIFLALFTLLLVGRQLAEVRGGQPRRQVVWRFAALLLVGVLLIGPYALYVARQLAGDVVVTLPLGDVNRWSADLLAFFVPSPLHPLWGALTAPIYRRFTGNLFEQTVYLGYVALALAGVALAGRRREARFWALSAGVFAVLCLGPLLHVAGRWIFEVDGVPVTIPLPGILLHFLPVLSGIRVLSRFDVMVTLSLAVLVGLGVSALTRRLSPWPGRPLLVGGTAAGLGLAILVEFLSAPLPVLSAEIPHVFRAMGAEAMPRPSLLDVPLEGRIAKYQYYQTAHQKPLILGFVPRPSPALLRQIEGVPFLEFFQGPGGGLPSTPTGWTRRSALRVLDLLDLDTIVIHGEYLDGATVERVRAVVMEYFPVARVVEENAMTVVRLQRDHDRLAVWTADAYDFDFAPATPRFFLARGWWPSERAGSSGMAWSRGRESTLGFFLPEAWAMTMELRLAPFSFPSAPASQRVAVSVNGRALGQLDLGREWGLRPYALEVPAAAVRAGFNTVHFAYAYAAAPSDVVPGNTDGRDLAVAFGGITLRRH